MLVPIAKVPVNLICLPTKYALKYMENSTYIELFYFMNQGIANAEEVATAPSDELFVWKQQDNGTPSLVEASTAKRGLKSDVLLDKKLSWEQFFEATPHIIQFMKRYHWLQDRHVLQFFTRDTEPPLVDLLTPTLQKVSSLLPSEATAPMAPHHWIQFWFHPGRN